MRSIARRAIGALLLAVVAAVAVDRRSAFAGVGRGGGGLSKHERATARAGPSKGKTSVTLIYRVEGRREQAARRRLIDGAGRIDATGTTASATSARRSWRPTRSRRSRRLAERRGASTSTGSSRSRIRGPRASAPVAPQTPPERGDAAGQPVHADRGTRGRRSSSLRTRPGTGAASPIGILDSGIDARPPDAARRRATGERKIVDWVTYTASRRPTATRRGSTWPPRSAAARSSSSARDLHGACGGSRTASASSTSATRASAARSATTSTATAIRPARAASSRCSGTRPRTRSGWTRTRTTPSPTRRR